MHQDQRHDFKSLNLGFASAETESDRSPELLLDGFYDRDGTTEVALKGERFIFLGYKGSGKSAIGKRIHILSQSDPLLRVTPLQLRDFPYKAFNRVGSSETEPESRYPTTWAWLLLVKILESFRDDEGGKFSGEVNVDRVLKILDRLGVTEARDISALVIKSSQRSFKASIPGILEIGGERSEDGYEASFDTVVRLLRKTVHGFCSEARHVLVIDGLDDILTHREVQYQALAGLQREVAHLNSEFREFGCPAQIILLCRTDLFELIPDGNKNKLRRDSAVELDWYHDPREPDSSALVALADLRVKLSTGDASARLEQYLPPSIESGVPTIRSLLELTRHTPRDFIQLLSCIQDFAIDGNILTVDQTLKGIRKYSIDYFLPEIKDEMVGAATPHDIEVLLSLVSAMRSRDFRYSNLTSLGEASGESGSLSKPLREILAVFYERSAIGTVHGAHGYDAYTFKYRNRNSVLGIPDRLMLHKGIWKALNVG